MVEGFVEPARPLDPLLIEPEFRRVAVLSDVHGNLPALEACLAEIAGERVDSIFFLGDLTWGPQPLEVLARVADLDVPTWFVKGNAERAVEELAAGSRPAEGINSAWTALAHGPDGVATVSAFATALDLRMAGLGTIRLCHGSPRSDIELLTPATPIERLERALAGVPNSVVGHGHTHLQYQRIVGERTVFGPGSVGIPYGTEGRPGARWALLEDTIELRVSDYDIEDAIAIARAVGYPGIVGYEESLRTPPTLAEIVDDAEGREFAD
jgi:putative phosphoesterase